MRFDARLKIVIIGFVGAVLLIGATLRAVDLGWRRERALGDAERRAAGLARILSEYLRELFAVTDASLRQLAILSPRLGGPAATNWAPVLNAARAGLTGIGALTVTDQEGIVRASTVPAIVGQPRRDDYLFRQIASSSSDALIAGTPFRTLSNQLTIPIGRRLTTSDGKFSGIVVATLIPDELRSFFKSIDVGTTGSVWVFHPQGIVLIHEPSPSDPIGDATVGNPIFEASRQRSTGMLRAPLKPAGASMLNAFVTEREPPLVVAVSLGEEEVLAEWRREAAISIATFALTAVICATVIWLLFRAIDARSQAQEQANVSETARQVAEGRAALADELERKNEELETFAYSVSHDLRSPLRSIDGFSKMLLEDYGSVLDATGRDHVTRVRSAAKRMVDLIEGLLALSRVSRSEMVRRPVGLSAMARSIADDLASREPERAVQFVIQEGLVADADDKMMHSVLENLLGNAWKFTSKTSGARIEFGGEPRPSGFTYFIRDNGAGFDVAHQANLFRPFQRLHSDRDFPGTGIGLATVRRVIERHGGKIGAESQIGYGATFFFTIDARA